MLHGYGSSGALSHQILRGNNKIKKIVIKERKKQLN